MCDYMSFKVSRTGKTVYFGGKSNSHSGIENHHGLAPDSTSECEWVGDKAGKLSIRNIYGETRRLRRAILRKFPNRAALESEAGRLGAGCRIRLNGKPVKAKAKKIHRLRNIIEFGGEYRFRLGLPFTYVRNDSKDTFRSYADRVWTVSTVEIERVTLVGDALIYVTLSDAKSFMKRRVRPEPKTEMGW